MGQLLGFMASRIKSNKMALRKLIALGLVFSLSACSTTTVEEEVVYNYPRHQLPAETRYGTTAWVQPPTVVPHDFDNSGFSTGSAPLLKPSDNPVKTNPRLPNSASRKY